MVLKLKGRSGCNDSRERYGDLEAYRKGYEAIFGKRKLKLWRPKKNDSRRTRPTS